MNKNDATYLAELRKDVRELTNVILSELKERYSEDAKILTRISEIEVKLAQFEKTIENFEEKLDEYIQCEKDDAQLSKKAKSDERKGRYAIAAALIAAIGSILVDLVGYLKELFK